MGLLGSSLCLLGLLLITASLCYSVQKHHQQQNKLLPNNQNASFANKFEVDGDGGFPKVTIFAAPRPFSSIGSDSIGARQELAVRSWLGLSPNVSIVLFGQHSSIHQFASSFGSRVVVESRIDFSFSGTPFFHSMVARSQASHSGISILIDPETILLPDIINTLHYVHRLNCDWFIVSISPSFPDSPFLLDETGRHWLQKDRKRIGTKKLQDFIVQNRQWQNCGERLFMAWNTGDLPLHAGVVPPFLYGKGLHNEWLLNEVLSSDFRFVIDASLVPSSFYIKNSGPHLERKWEYEGNHHLASLYGSLYYRPNNSLQAKIVQCSGQHLLLDLAHGTFHSLNSIEKQSWLSPRFLQSHRRNKLINCMEGKSPCSDWQKVSLKMPMPLNFSLSLKSLLNIVADEDKTVVLAVVGDNYRDMLMNWVCRLRSLAVTNFIVCALDPDIYQFSVLQGLPVFKDPLAPSYISFNDCHFGTKCFQRVTKVKSRIVLQILKLGYNVLMSDVDIYWFENPLPYLRSFGPATLLAQSDEYNEKGPINLPRRLNSGFYYARSEPPIISAIEMVVKHASNSNLSEQPSFYDVLCGKEGVNRVGDDRCVEPKSNLTIIFLNRNLFPNGAYKDLWRKSKIKSACSKLKCIIIHNNWISGRKKKLERQIRSRLWEYDSSSRMCAQSWQRIRYY